MPFSRYQIRNEYSLADPDLYKTADKDDPEALLEGVAMAGLVGVLRQLGDLAEFAAEIFHGLHEEVMVTAARGHGLLVRVQQLESDFPSVERAFLSQTGYSAFFSSPGISWHPNLQTEQNHITRGDLPRFVMDSYEECRGPPRLFLLDKFDVAGAGACLKRYTDPSFYKVEASSYEMTSAETQRDKKIRRTKKRGPGLKNGGTPEVLQPSHVKLHQLLLEERLQNGVSEPARSVKLKKRQNKFPFDTEDGKGYMERLLTSPSVDKLVHEVPFASSTLRLHGESGIEIPEGSMVMSPRQTTSPDKSPSVDKTVEELPTLSHVVETEVEEKHISVDGYQSDDVASEADNYVDALTTMESENETDAEIRTNSDAPSIIKQEPYLNTNLEQPDSQSVSDGGSNSVMNKIESFSYSDTTSTSSNSRAFACTEIPFHPRVPPSEAFPVDQEPILKETSSRESDLSEMSSNNSLDLNSPARREENEIDSEAIIASTSKLLTSDDPSSLSFEKNPECLVDNEDCNSKASVVIHVQDTTCGTGESSSREASEAECAGDDYTRNSIDSGQDSLEDVKPSGKIHAYSPDNYVQNGQLKDDDILVSISDLVSYSCDEETELKKIETEAATADVYRNGDTSVCTREHEETLEMRELQSSNSETNASNGHENDTELENIETEAGVAVPSDEPSVITPELSCNHSNDQLLDSILVTCDMNQNENLNILQDQSQIVIEKTDQTELQIDVDSALNSPFLTEAETGFYLDYHESEVKSVNQGDEIGKLEAASSVVTHSVLVEEKVDQSVPELEHVDHESLHLESTTDVSVSEQAFSSHTNLVEYPLAPINLEEAPPLPPLPPMQWRMGKLHNAQDDGQHRVNHIPPMFPQMASHTSLDRNVNANVLPSLQKEEDDNSVIHSQVSAESQKVSISGREIIWPSITSAFPVVDDDERPNGIRPMKIQRPRTPLIDAVAAHDKSKLRKVSERSKPEMQKKEEERATLLQLRKVSQRHIPKQEERDTLLEQIRAKSLKLKPAVQTRPTIQGGPTTNLRVAAILEKANAIRQAFAGSDDDDEHDEDDNSWSDS